MPKDAGYLTCGMSGILQSSSGFLPQTSQLPILLVSIGLLLAQVPRNSLPVTRCRILISKKAAPNTAKMTAKRVRKLYMMVHFGGAKITPLARGWLLFHKPMKCTLLWYAFLAPAAAPLSGCRIQVAGCRIQVAS